MRSMYNIKTSEKLAAFFVPLTILESAGRRFLQYVSLHVLNYTAAR
jgi:hypothetical protein